MWSGDQGLNDKYEDPEVVITLLKDEENKSEEEE